MTLGGVLKASGLYLDVSGFKYLTNPPAGTPSVSATITAGAASVSLFGGTTPFSSTVTGFKGLVRHQLQDLSLGADEADVTAGDRRRRTSP